MREQMRISTRVLDRAVEQCGQSLALGIGEINRSDGMLARVSQEGIEADIPSDHDEHCNARQGERRHSLASPILYSPVSDTLRKTLGKKILT
jgi:hypothetical protein